MMVLYRRIGANVSVLIMRVDSAVSSRQFTKALDATISGVWRRNSSLTLGDACLWNVWSMIISESLTLLRR